MDPKQAETPAPPVTPSAVSTPDVPTASVPPPPVGATSGIPNAGTNPVSASPTPPTKGKSKMMMIVIIIVLLVIVAAGVYLYWAKSNSHKPMAMAQPAKQVTVAAKVPTVPTPVISPVTSANVDQTLNNTDTTVQKATTQATTDLNSVSSINASQDSTSGL